LKFGNFVINARFDEVKEKRMFKNLVETNRCAVIIDGYYEWRQNVPGAQNKSGSVPYFITLKNTFMILAALKMDDKIVLMT
jgi:putative SOS response-associated peptidase YedK